VVEHPPSKCKTLSSSTSIAREKEREREREWENQVLSHLEKVLYNNMLS
jgi:hypothetical protein